jgi:alanyl-tRNA synthetase
MTDRLYYNDPSLLEFDATITSVATLEDGNALVALDRSAFYPTSGGQNFDTGVMYAVANGARVRVIDVQDDEQTGDILHLVECAPAFFQPGAPVRGEIDAARRRDHMQQHTGQHVLSAAFERLYGFTTVSFHMGDDYCSIDLATDKISPAQVDAAERLANEVVLEDRPVEIRYATLEEATTMGVRKIPPAVREKLRLIDIREFDLIACGGTHVRSTGQIGAILLRKTEKVKQGTRVEFVCGLRAVSTARRDFQALTEAASVYSAHIWEVPQQARRSLDEIKSGQKAQQRLLEEVAELTAANFLRVAQEQPSNSGPKLVVEFFADRDLAFIKLLAQKIVRLEKAIALLACGGAQPSLVFAQTSGLSNDMGALMKETLQKLGTRGGGNRDMAQGGAPDASSAELAIREAASKIR